MPRKKTTGLLLTFVLAACSAKTPAPAPGDTPRPTSPLSAATPGLAHAATMPAPDPREAALSTIVLRLLEQEHLLGKKIDDSVSHLAFETYIDRLDGSKMFLLQSDRDALVKHSTNIDDQLRSGSLDLAHDGAKRFAARVAVVEKLVAELTAAPLDLTNEEFTEIDPKKLQLAANEQELRDRWRRRLELEVLERIAAMEQRLNPDKAKAKDPAADDDDDAAERALPISKIPTTPEGREAKARADLAKTYAGRFARLLDPGPLDAAADLINAVSATIDPHSNYLPPADKANFDIQMTGSLEGIGAVLREKDHLIEIVELVPGGASWRHGGISAGDVILAVQENGDPVDVFDMRIDQVVKMIRGKAGTVVRLRVQKPTGEEQTVAITRDVVVLEEAYAKGAVLERKGKRPVGYIHLPSFYGGKGNAHTAAGDVRKLLAELKQRKVAGVVLDIRSNGGGILGDAIEMTGALIDKGPVVQVKDSDGQREVLADERAGVDYDGPVVVLVDRFSASASEIVAGALQDYGRAVVVGTGPTHGKGTVQTLADLDRATGNKIELGVFKITIQQFFRVSGSSTQREGVIPDILLPDPAGHIESGERELEHAIAWSQVKPAPHVKWPATWKTTTLVANSAARVAKHPLLAKIATSTAMLKARQNDTRVPLAKPAWDTRRKELRAALEAAAPDLKKAPAVFTVKPITNGNSKPIAPGPGGKTDDRPAKWNEAIARDPWVEESVNVLADMAK